MTFTIRPAVRAQVPLLIGIVSKSGGGKTYSALRLAAGIQAVVGGEVVGIDTEANRMLHYADEFKFHHLSMGAPFGSLDYMEAIKAALDHGAKTIIVDSMSHEHEGAGGYLDLHETEVIRLQKPTREGGGGFNSAFAAQIPAWSEPAKRRRKLINFIVQTPCNFIFCFRAKDKIEIPKKGSASRDPISHPNQPIAGEEFVFEMLNRFLLLPGSGGIPDWSEEPSVRRIAKTSNAVAPIFEKPRPLDEWTGRQLARWALGTGADKKLETRPDDTEQKPEKKPADPDAPTLDECLSIFESGQREEAIDLARGLSTDDQARFEIQTKYTSDTATAA